MAEQAEITHETDEERNNRDKPFWAQYRLFHAAFAQFCYTGAQGTYTYSEHSPPFNSSFNCLAFEQWQSQDTLSTTLPKFDRTLILR